MSETLNTAIADALTEQQLVDMRHADVERRHILAALALLLADLLAALRMSEPTAPRLLVWRLHRVEQLVEESLAPLIASRYALIAAHASDALVRIAQAEATAMQRIVNDLAGEPLLTVSATTTALNAIVTTTLFPSVTTATGASATMPDWWTRQADGLTQRLGDQLKVSVSLEETLAQAVARVQGTAEAASQDGIMQRARDDAAVLLRTSTTHTIAETRVAVAEANSEALSSIQHVSILDNRTSAICQARDGLQFTADTHEPLGHNIPYLQGIPYHAN